MSAPSQCMFSLLEYLTHILFAYVEHAHEWTYTHAHTPDANTACANWSALRTYEFDRLRYWIKKTRKHKNHTHLNNKITCQAHLHVNRTIETIETETWRRTNCGGTTSYGVRADNCVFWLIAWRPSAWRMCDEIRRHQRVQKQPLHPFI